MKIARIGVIAAVLLGGAGAGAEETLRNWFDDPFEAVTQGLPGCPAPLGPLLTHEAQRREAHWRIERGTSCWLAGKCQDSNAYRYDRAIAPRAAAALRAVPGAEGTSVWITVQRRIVFLEGCVASDAQKTALERAVGAVADVESVVPALMTGTRGKPPYALRDAARAVPR